MEPKIENYDARELILYIDNTERFYTGKMNLFEYYSKKLQGTRSDTVKKIMEMDRIRSFKTLCRTAGKDYTERLANIELKPKNLFSKLTRHDAVKLLEKEFLEYHSDMVMAEPE